ncbi:MAG TPA: type 1 glutamine amidotransferase domain-containing protein [Sphingomicrobium sp.]|nr:type 1 glutamine amidotransferase domain-containing protein [Sphingomicrobium sp.]
MTKPRILIITTSHASMGNADEKTGVWLEELTTPYYAFADGGADVTLSSIAGGPVPIDPRSTGEDSKKEESVRRYLDDAVLQAKVAKTPAFTSLDGSDYDAVFLPGGHGTMWDYPTSTELAALVSQFLETGKPVAAVCHGPAGLTQAKTADGRSIVAGKKVSGFTNGEEEAVGLTKVVPFLLEDRLRQLGGDYEKGPDFAPFAVRDGLLITGQNPASAAKVAELTLEAVEDKVTA